VVLIEPVEEKQEKPLEEKDVNYAHTFAVLKGELLMCQMLEPEVVHFVAAFSDILSTIFRTFCDVPIGGSGGGGAMTCAGFQKCCDDFGLFPGIMDYQTAQWLYYSAECAVDTPQPDTGSPCGSARSSRRGSTVGTGRKRSASSRRTSAVRRAPGSTRRSSSKGRPEQARGDGSLFYGRWLMGHLTWLTKDFGAMSEEEQVASRILWAINEWADAQSLSLQEFFAFLDEDKSGSVSANEIQVGLDFMQFANPPTTEEIKLMLRTIQEPRQQNRIDPENATVDFDTWNNALMAVRKQRESCDRAANCFLKDIAKMSKEEVNACIFFKEIWKLLTERSMTPAMLFEEMDADGSGTVTSDELTKQVHRILRLRGQVSPALTIMSPFELIDLNNDGEISQGEFITVLEKVKEAQLTRELSEESNHPILFSQAAPTCPGMTETAGKKIFGVEAFTECLLKAAFMHLTHHGETKQRLMPSSHKALWLLMYMSWQFSKKKKHAKDFASKSQTTLALDSGATRKYPKYVSPMQRLVKSHPRLFQDALSRPAMDEQDPLLVAGLLRPDCWGAVVEPLLQAALKEGVGATACGNQSLDRLLLAKALSCC